MSIGTRIKEQRLSLKLTQEELANRIGATKGAIANYENGVSSPKLDLMYKLFDALDCDANYLFQDEMNDLKDVALSASERIMIHNYRELDAHGREMVDFTLQKEWERSLECSKNNVINIVDNDKSEPYITTKAANSIDNATPEQNKHDDNIMDNDDEWK